MWLIGVVMAMAGLPVEAIQWEVTVRGPVAEAWVSQRIVNSTPHGLEGVYRLALPAEGAVDALEFTLGDTVVTGVIETHEGARARFDQARAIGRTAALTQQTGASLFEQHVTNIPPGETLYARVRVTWPVRRIDGAYELTLPTEAAPRFGESEALGQPTSVPYTLDLDIDAGFDVVDTVSPSHLGLPLQWDGPKLTLHDASLHTGRDLIVHWRPDFSKPQVTALSSPHHTVAVVEGPDQPATEDAPTAWLIVLDTSGSMSGTAWTQAVPVVRELSLAVREQDSIALVTFGNHVQSTEPAVGEAGTRRVLARLASVGPNGGTYLSGGVDAMANMQADSSRERAIVIISDGLVSDEAGVIQSIARSEGDQVAMVLVGDHPNHGLIERMAAASGGYAMRVLPGEHSTTAVQRLRSALLNPQCTDLEVEWGGTMTQHTAVPRGLYAGRPIVVAAEHDRSPDWVEARCATAGNRWSRRIAVREVTGHDALRRLYGRARLEALQLDADRGVDVRGEGTALALHYGLVSPWTSLVAVGPEGMWSPPPASDDVLTQDFLNQIPPGRSFQSAVGIVGGGGNPNIAGGAYTENTYMLDGVNITDRVTGTFSLNFRYPEDPPVLDFRGPHPHIAAGSRFPQAGLRGALTTRGGHSVGAVAAGDIVPDLLTGAARADAVASKGVVQNSVDMRLDLLPTASSLTTASGASRSLVVGDARATSHSTTLASTWWDRSPVRTTGAATVRSDRGAAHRHQIALAHLFGAYDDGRFEGAVDASVARSSDLDTAAITLAQTDLRALYDTSRHLALGEVGLVHAGRTVPVGSLHAEYGDADHARVSADLRRDTPALADWPSATAELPVTTQASARLTVPMGDHVTPFADVEWAHAETWGISRDLFRVDLPADALADRGWAAAVGVDVDTGGRLQASALAVLQRRAPLDSLDRPGIEHMALWTDRLRDYHVTSRVEYTLRWLSPIFEHIAAELEMLGRIAGIDAEWARARSAWALEVHTEVWPAPRLTATFRLEHGVGTGLPTASSPPNEPIPYSRLDPSVRSGLRAGLTVEWTP